jgi:hypothetical protein
VARDVYGEARALGVEVWDAGHPDWSKRIDDVVAGGATATEILMGLRWTLGELLDQVPDLEAGLRGRVESLRGEIGTILGAP